MVLKPWDGMNDLFDAVSPSASQQELIEARIENVTKVLRSAFPSTSNVVFQSATAIGSTGRGTASKPINDIDLMVRLNVDQALWDSTYQSDSQKFLYRVRDAIDGSTTVQKVGARAQAVRFFYADGLCVDIAAVEKHANGGYMIPDGTGGWQRTNPLVHSAYIEQKQSEFDSHFKRFVQVVKQWNRAHGNYLHSFHLEMMVARTFTSLSNNRRTALRTFFDVNYNNLSVDDPARYSGDLSSYLTTSARDQVNTNILNAYAKAKLAVDAENKGDHKEAIRLWRQVLGEDYPLYG